MAAVVMNLSDGTVLRTLILVHLALGKSPAGFDPITLHEQALQMQQEFKLW